MTNTPETNDQLVLIAGESGTGKSASLKEIEEQDKWLYLNSEAGKRLPFRNKFDAKRIEDPWQVHEAFDYATNDAPNEYRGIIIDSITFLMDMFESQYVLTASDTQKAWSQYAQFFKVLMQEKVVKFAKPVIILGHTKDQLDEKEMAMKTSVPIKGALKNQGVEAYFSTVVATKKVSIKELENFQNDLLTITDEDKELGYKHIFQTRLTKKTVGERIRSPMGLFDKSQTYMDNNAQLLLDHLHAFYG